MADNQKLVEAMSYIATGLRLATEFLTEEKRMQGASTEELNKRSEELYNQTKKMLEEDSSKDRAEISSKQS